MQLPQAMQPHTVTVEPKLGTTATGPSFGPGVPLKCFRDGKTRLILGTDGTRKASGTTLATSQKSLDNAGLTAIPLGSRVSWASGSGVVESIDDGSDSGLGAWEHLEISLV